MMFEHMDPVMSQKWVEFCSRKTGFENKAGLLIRPIRNGFYDTCTPYVYGVPLLKRFDDKEISRFIQIGPYYNEALVGLLDIDGLGYLRFDPYVVVNLQNKMEEKISKKRMYCIRKGMENAIISQAVTDMEIEKAVDVINGRMFAVGAPDFYKISVDDYRYLVNLFGDAVELMMLIDSRSGNVAAAILGINGSRVYQFSYGGFKEEYPNAYSALLFHIMKVARDRGCLYFDLGGVGYKENTILNFKLSFTDHPLSICSVGIVYDKARYNGFVNGKRVENYFPEYRGV